MALIGRIVVIFLALMLAMLATGITIALGIWGPSWHALTVSDVPERVVFGVTAFFAVGFTAASAFLPTLVLIALAETFKIRSLLLHLAAGALLLVASSYAYGLVPPPYEESIDHPPPMVPREVEIAAAAGAVFGLTYWLLAGRNAGRWREKRS